MIMSVDPKLSADEGRLPFAVMRVHVLMLARSLVATSCASATELSVTKSSDDVAAVAPGVAAGDVCADHVLDDLDFDELPPELNGRAASWGTDTAGRVAIGLFADDEAFAAELIALYGDCVDIRVGAFEYPLPDPLPASICPGLDETTERGDLDIVAVGPVGPFERTGDDVLWIELAVELTNTGTGRVEFDPGTASGYLIDSDRRVVAGPGQLEITAVGMAVDLAPGESSTLPVKLSTTSSDRRVGHLAPPGDHQLVAVVDQGIDAGLRSSPIDVLVE